MQITKSKLYISDFKLRPFRPPQRSSRHHCIKCFDQRFALLKFLAGVDLRLCFRPKIADLYVATHACAFRLVVKLWLADRRRRGCLAGWQGFVARKHRPNRHVVGDMFGVFFAYLEFFH